MTQHQLTERAKAAVCTRCGSHVIAAVTGGLTTITDIEPLTAGQEIAALLTGRATFDLHTAGKAVYLEWRDIIRIRAAHGYPVVAQHQCGPGARLEPLPAPAAEEVPDDPPF